MMRRAFLAVPLLLLAGCEPADNEPGPGGVTVGEARALDQAAEMLEQRRLPPDALGRPGESAGDPGADPAAQPSPPADPPPAQ